MDSKSPDSTYIFFVMGVSGSGKTTIGKLLAQTLGYPFFDGDDYHPEKNIKKMAQGIPLTDTDRQGWLEGLNQLAWQHSSKGAVIACSALKRSYRILLGNGLDKTCKFIFLNGSFQDIQNRINQRKDHFMPAALLASQFETLEPPQDAINVAISDSPEVIVDNILMALGQKKST